MKSFDIKEVYVSWAPLGQSVLLYTAWIPTFAAPLAFVWGNPKSTTPNKHVFDVYGSYVLPWARRQGVRSKINEQILKHYGVIITGSGTKEGGMAFLKAAGYKLHKPTGLFFLQKGKCKCRKK